MYDLTECLVLKNDFTVYKCKKLFFSLWYSLLLVAHIEAHCVISE